MARTTVATPLRLLGEALVQHHLAKMVTPRRGARVLALIGSMSRKGPKLAGPRWSLEGANETTSWNHRCISPADVGRNGAGGCGDQLPSLSLRATAFQLRRFGNRHHN